MAIHESSGNGSGPGGNGGPGPSFPQRNAFVLQFAAGSGPQTFHGRVQHVASGQQTVFDSLEELRTFVGQVLSASSGVPSPAADDG